MAEFKKQIAKGNLIKSLAISGGITSVITAAGLAISIPVYNRLKSNLNEVSSQVADLSKFMSSLTNKLGIPAGQTFEKELAGGYTLLYSNGKTMIYAGSGDQKSLVMNMNQDGTVGSAAKLEGPAAQQMLGIISEAKTTIGSEADAMEDIMQDFVDQTRESSLANESALTGASKDALIARNALSVDRKLTQAEKDQLLEDAANASGANLSALKNAQQDAQNLIQEIKDRIKQERAARKLGKNGLADLRKRRAIAQKQEAIDYLNDNSHSLSNVWVSGTKYSDITAAGNEQALSVYYQKKKIKDARTTIASAKRKVATDWLDKQNISYKNVAFKDTIGDGPNAQEKTYADLADGNHDETLQNFYVYQVAKLAKVKTEDQQIQKATTSGKGSSILQKVASSITSWPSMYVKAKYGYTRPNGDAVSASSQLLKGLQNVLQQQGVSAQNFNRMIGVLDKLLDVQNGKPTKTFKLTTILNTYNTSEAAQARLLVLKVDKTDLNGDNLETQYIVARSSTRNIVDLEKITLSDTADLSKTIYYLAQSANTNFAEAISRQSILKLISFVESNNPLKKVKDKGNEFNELIKVSSILETMPNNAQKAYVSKILFALLENYLFNGKEINNVQGDKLLAAARAVMKTDNALNDSVSSSVTQNPASLYSLNNNPWMQKLYDFVTEEEFNYDYLDTFARNLSFFDNLDKDLKTSVNKNKAYLSTAFDIIFDKPAQGQVRTDKAKLKLDLGTFVQMSKVAKGSKFDITKPANVSKIKAATEVSSLLQAKSMSSQNAQAISNLIIDIVVADILSEDQFAEIVKYTDTIYAFGFSEAKVFNILNKVLRPGFNPGTTYGIREIQQNKDNLIKVVDEQITKLNTWVENVKTKLNKDTITQDQLEAYIWTLQKHSEEYEYDSSNAGNIEKGTIVSASIIDGKTYIVDHNLISGKRRVWESDNTSGTTILKIIAEFNGSDSGGNHISSQFAGENGRLYWTQLTPQSTDDQILFEWDPEDPTKLKSWKIKGSLMTQLTNPNNWLIRSLFILDNEVFFSLTGSPQGEISSSNPIDGLEDPTADEITLKPNIMPASIDAKWITSWTSSGFVRDNTKFFIAALKANSESNIVIWTEDGSSIRFAEMIKTNIFGGHIVAVVMGNYEQETKQQTFFVVGSNGALVKYVVQITDENGDLNPSFIGEPIKLISGLDQAEYGETRGATYIDGAITLYSVNKVTYIQDQTANLNDIFRNLLNE